jgi:uncharacterized caspase-like protein
VLGIGVSDYAEASLKLDLPAKDAGDFIAALKAQEGGLYREVVTRPLTDREATRGNILDGFEWLEKQVTSRDVGVVFMAGHGAIDEVGRFWFLPSDASPTKLRASAVSKEEIRSTLGRLAGKAILFLDACHAAGVSTGEKTRGDVDVNGLINEIASSENGVVVFGASQGRELSLENPAWGNGAFTKAVVEGIRDGKAALLNKKAITLSELDAYITDRVKELTDGRQHPVMQKPGTIANFPIAVAK